MLEMLARLYWTASDGNLEQLDSKEFRYKMLPTMERRVREEWKERGQFIRKNDLTWIGQILQELGVEEDNDGLEDSMSWSVKNSDQEQELDDFTEYNDSFSDYSDEDGYDVDMEVESALMSGPANVNKSASPKKGVSFKDSD